MRNIFHTLERLDTVEVDRGPFLRMPRDGRGVTLGGIARAARTIDPAFRDTPQFCPDPLGHRLGCRLVVKVETLNPVGSFKARGALWYVAQAVDANELVCATAGNFGLAMAYASARAGINLTVFTGASAPTSVIIV